MHRDDSEARVSRYTLNTTINKIIKRAHDRQRYSRAEMGDGVCEQRYGNLGRRALQEIGLMDLDSPLFKSKRGLSLDLEYAGSGWRASLAQEE